MLYTITTPHSKKAQLCDREFRRNSYLQTACDTWIARATGLRNRRLNHCVTGVSCLLLSVIVRQVKNCVTCDLSFVLLEREMYPVGQQVATL